LTLFSSVIAIRGKMVPVVASSIAAIPMIKDSCYPERGKRERVGAWVSEWVGKEEHSDE
jgi:hypothetical protein